MKKPVWLFASLFLVCETLVAQQPGIKPAAAACLLADAAVVKPNDALLLEHIPDIPASIAERADRYTQYRTAALYDWNPKRREILIGTRFADTVQVHSVAMPGGARTQLTFFPDRVLGASFHPHADDYFIFSKDAGGGEWYQFYRFDTDDGDTTLLTDGKSRNSGMAWSNHGDRIAYSSTRRTGADNDFYVMNPADRSTDKLLARNSGGGWTDAKGVYLITDRGNEFRRVAYMDLATKSLKYLNFDSWDVEDARLSKGRRLLAYAIN
jgi:hypothetical protein